MKYEHDIFADANKKFWMVSAHSEGLDQTQRFLSDGIWEMETSSPEIKKMHSGDLIAIKESFLKQDPLPFDYSEKPVPCMRIKAIGIITDGSQNGKSIKVDWQELDLPRYWYFDSHRGRITEIEPHEDQARQLIMFTFANIPQDYDFWLKKQA